MRRCEFIGIIGGAAVTEVHHTDVSRIWKAGHHRVVDLRCVRRISGNLVECAAVGDF
jgi:hypothetical protein